MSKNSQKNNQGKKQDSQRSAASHGNRGNRNSQKSPDKFPYRFARREKPKEHGQPPPHNKLAKNRVNRVDVAFEITWTTLTPTAANPCVDPEADESCPNNNDEYKGYNKRWLMIDNKLAISPFTVKSAIANAVANLLGSCYRVQSKKVGHSDLGEGYPYTGKYKRYRVSMGGTSLPGILLSIEKCKDGKGRKVEIQPVKKEYYSKKDVMTEAGFDPDNDKLQKLYAAICCQTDKNSKRLINKPYEVLKVGLKESDVKNTQGAEKTVKLYYFGPYEYGMNLEGKQRDKTPKEYKQRFVSFPDNCHTDTGIIPEINFVKSADELKEHVYAGWYKHDHQKKEPWFENLDNLKNGDFVYYEKFNCQVTNIGKNFLFKALFLHEDTIPDGYETCDNMEELCPRCAMFGMTDDRDVDNKEAVGYAGRFKSATLVCDEQINKIEKLDEEIPFFNNQQDNAKNKKNIEVQLWKNGEKILCRQMLLPILGEPKPNKRDVDGYYDPDTGLLKGAKRYIHGDKGVKDINCFLNSIKSTIDSQKRLNRKGSNFAYAHRLRNYAMVCETGLDFSGTVGLENASADEIAALIMALDTRVANHGFKIGLGKSLGLGSMETRISRIWIRKEDKYDKWEPIDIEKEDSREQILKAVKDAFEKADLNVTNALKTMKDVQKTTKHLNNVTHMTNRRLKFPEPGWKYWEKACRTGLNNTRD